MSLLAFIKINYYSYICNNRILYPLQLFKLLALYIHYNHVYILQSLQAFSIRYGYEMK